MTDPGRFLKSKLRRVPGLRKAYGHVRILRSMVRERFGDLERLNDRSHLEREWNFALPAEQERYARVLEAVSAQCGVEPWGDALEIGCAEGLFTVELSERCRSVVACDISSIACARAAQRCAGRENVRIVQLDIDRNSIPGTYDLVFVMGVLSFIHGRDKLARVGARLAHVLRPGGLLVLNEMRLRREFERSWWIRLLAEGGIENAAFLDGRHGFRLVRQDLHGGLAHGYVVALFEKLAGRGER